jgi:hypothetical protein
MDARSAHPRSSGLSAPWCAPLPELLCLHKLTSWIDM